MQLSRSEENRTGEQLEAAEAEPLVDGRIAADPRFCCGECKASEEVVWVESAGIVANAGTGRQRGQTPGRGAAGARGFGFLMHQC